MTADTRSCNGILACRIDRQDDNCIRMIKSPGKFFRQENLDTLNKLYLAKGCALDIPPKNGGI